MTPQTSQAETIRFYTEINIPPASQSAWADIRVPPGNWRVVSILALASLGPNGPVTTDVETIITSNPEFQLKASESGAVETIFSGGTLRAAATKRTMSDVFVRVITTLKQR